MSGTYDSSIRRSTRRLTVARTSSSSSSPFSSRTVCSSSFMYISKPTRLDVAALLAAEQVAGAANLEVERRDAEAAAEIAELLDRGEPLLRDRRQVVFRRNQQIRVGRPIGSADAAAQLIELRQAVPIGAVDDDRVGVRDVEAVFDDRRRQQHVELLRRRSRASRARARPRPSARGRRRRAPPARGAESGCRSRRSTRRGCGRSTPARRAPARCESRGRSPADRT